MNDRWLVALEDGRIVEQWDVLQPMPNEFANGNTLFREEVDTRRSIDERAGVTEAAEKIAAAIARRDAAAIRELLAPDFVHRTHGGAGVDVDAFIAGIEQIPGEIMFVRLEQLEVDLCASAALVTGVQHAQVLVNGQVVDDRRGFVDWFVKHAGEWRIQAAVDLPGPDAG